MQVNAAQHEEPALAVDDLNDLLGVTKHHEVVERR